MWIAPNQVTYSGQKLELSWFVGIKGFSSGLYAGALNCQKKKIATISH